MQVVIRGSSCGWFAFSFTVNCRMRYWKSFCCGVFHFYFLVWIGHIPLLGSKRRACIRVRKYRDRCLARNGSTVQVLARISTQKSLKKLK